MANFACFEDKLVFLHFTMKHFFFDIFELAFRKVVEDEMVFEAAEDEIRIRHCLLFGLDCYMLSDPVLHSLNFLHFLASCRLT